MADEARIHLAEELDRRYLPRVRRRDGRNQLGFGELMSFDTDSEETFLMRGLIGPNEKGVIVGAPKQLKTWLALNMARALSCGEPFVGNQAWQVPEAQRVLFVEEEGSQAKFVKRVQRVFAGVEDAPFEVWFKRGFNLIDETAVEELHSYVCENQIDVVFLDPWQRMIPGIDENSASEQRAAWDAVHRLSTVATVILLYHANKSGSEDFDAMRGSSRGWGEVDFGFNLKKQGKGSLRVRLDGRDLEDTEDDYFETTFEDPAAMSFGGWSPQIVRSSKKGNAAKGDKNKAALVEFISSRGGATKRQLLEHFDGSMVESTVKAHLRDLTEDGVLVAVTGVRGAKTYEVALNPVESGPRLNSTNDNGSTGVSAPG